MADTGPPVLTRRTLLWDLGAAVGILALAGCGSGCIGTSPGVYPLAVNSRMKSSRSPRRRVPLMWSSPARISFASPSIMA